MEMNFFSRQNEVEEEEYEMHGQALPVKPFDINSVDERTLPLTSQEYLQQVIAQRAKLPAVVTASVPKLITANPPNIAELFREEELIQSEHRPSKEWQQMQVSDFSDLRFRIECNREKWERKIKYKFPSSPNDWFEFMFGRNEDDGSSQKEPFLDIVLSMNNELIENLIKLIVEWVKENKITIYQAGLWFYALLACIDVPLRIKIMKQLRTFAYVCRDLRSKIVSRDEGCEKELVAQNLFICLISKYFGQRDLSD